MDSITSDKSRLARRSERVRAIADRRALKSESYRKATVLEPEALAQLTGRQRRRLYRQQFKAFRRWRTCIVPKSTIGLVTLVLSFSVGVASSGLVLYSWYQYRIDETNKRVDNFVTGFGERFDTAVKTINAETQNGRAQIRTELGPLARQQAEGEAITSLLQTLAPSMYLVQTRDVEGVASVATAWVVTNDADKSYLITSYDAIEANTRNPAPGIELVKGDKKLGATLVAWQPERDLALLSVDQNDLPRLELNPDSVKIGDRIFAGSGYGAMGSSVVQGFVNDVNADSISHDAQVGTAFRGGPLLDSDGKVVGVASRAYAPSGFKSDGVYFGIPNAAICEKVVKCSSGKGAPTVGG